MNRTAAVLAAGAALAAVALPAAAQTPFPTVAPRPGAAASVTPPAPVTRKLANGLTVLYVRRPEVPTVQATLVVRGAGTTDDPATSPGLATFTAGMLDEGAGGRSALQLADAFDLLGAQLSTTAAWDAAQVNLYSLRANFPAALRLMADVVARPDFPEREVARVRDERLTALLRSRDDPGTIANNAFPALVYGAGHPYGRFATTEATRGLDRARVSAFHASRYRPEASTLILVGDVDPAALHSVVESSMGGWRATGAAPASAASSLTTPTIGKSVVYLIDKPGAAQSEIRVGHPGVARDNPDFFPLQVLNTLLGGAFTSRLNTNLREKRGWSYGARSGYSMRLGAGPFTAQAGVMTGATDSALVEFVSELNRIRSEPVMAEELDKAKRYVALGFPQTFETNPQVASQLANLVTYGLDPAFFSSYVQRVMAVTSDDVRRVANQYVRPGNSVIVVVGDRAKVEAGIRAANLGAVEIREVAEFTR
ncbi:MAG TPA: pitrilysin family protein [Longimicrobium sp.]|nr:pitrilysin family protein [Longimicrobium sp.]